MFDISLTRLHEVTIILYALSVLLYFIDFLHNNRKANKVAFWLLVIVWLLQTIFLCLYVVKTGRFPILTLFEGLYFYVWVLITLSLVINKILTTDFLVFFTNVLGFIVMVIHTFAPLKIETHVLAQQLMSELLSIHITISLLAYGTFTLSFVFSILYLIQYDLLKRKKWGKRLMRLGDLSKLEKLSYILNVIGVPILFFGLVLGLQWAYIKLPEVSWFDVKILGSMVILLCYILVIYVKIRKQVNGKMLAYWNITCFLIVLINFFLFSGLSNFHYWST
ncbi:MULTISPECIES: cytochrome C assembly family protein [Bacillus]|uniref:cytochrome C assembly family protein n=1 Tax=Bacillus TaxID=1386 RepID=UPI00030B7F65|nr:MULTISPECIES: cytochrome c biogenesis protein CcsA [Bacillus]